MAATNTFVLPPYLLKEKDMILLADSGSTKTTWMELETGNKVVTEGLNPHFTTDEQFSKACNDVMERLGVPNRVYFYGAGCGNNAQRHRVQRLLASDFNADNVDVETDMLGACRATAGNQPSLVAILGTGSNACLYDGEKITHQPTSTGYILGDKGSANHVGRVLLNGYLTHHMPSRLRHMFHDAYHLSDAHLIDAVYHQPHPNRFLASLAPFAVQHIDDDYCRRVVSFTLEDWWLDALMPLYRKDDALPLRIVGGYAKAIESMLRSVMENNGLSVFTVLADPIDGLREYHQIKGNPYGGKKELSR